MNVPYEHDVDPLAVIAAIAEGLVVQDDEGRILACNPAAERILGLSRRQLEGRTSIDPRWRAVHEDGSPFPGEEHPAMVTLRTGEPQSNVIMGVHKPDGSLTWISINARPLGVPSYGVVATFNDITEQRLGYGQGSESGFRRACLEFLEERINEVQMVVDPDDRFVEVNDQAVAAYGYTREEFSRMTIHDIRVESSVATARMALDRIATEGGIRFESEHRRKNGERFPVEISGRAFQHGDRVLLHTLVRDLTVQSRAEREHALLAGLVRTMHDAVIVTDTEFRITTFTGAARRIYGWEDDEVLGKCLITDFVAEYPDRNLDITAELRAGRHVRTELRARRSDGSWIDLDMHADVLRDAGGQVSGYFSVSRDISSVKAAERRLRESELQLSLALSANQDGLWDVDLLSRTGYSSARCSEILGLGARAITDSTAIWYQRVHPEDLQRVQRALGGFTGGTSPQLDLEHRVMDRDDREVWVHSRGRIVEWTAEGRPLRAIGTLTDVSQRHADEEQLKRALRDNERLVDQLREALDNVKTLSGLVPICAWCKRIRNDAGFWQQIDEYVSQHTEATFSHGMCQECFDQFQDDGHANRPPSAP